jgi:hypothetical protein
LVCVLNIPKIMNVDYQPKLAVDLA